MKSLYRRKIFIFNFNVLFIYKTSLMYVIPASHLKVHAAIEKGLADECFCGFILLMAAAPDLDTTKKARIQPDPDPQHWLK
jgi:hypothetical protein